MILLMRSERMSKRLPSFRSVCFAMILASGASLLMCSVWRKPPFRVTVSVVQPWWRECSHGGSCDVAASSHDFDPEGDDEPRAGRFCFVAGRRRRDSGGV